MSKRNPLPSDPLPQTPSFTGQKEGRPPLWSPTGWKPVPEPRRNGHTAPYRGIPADSVSPFMTPCEEQLKTPAVWHRGEGSSCIFKSLPSSAKLSCHLAHPECLPPPRAPIIRSTCAWESRSSVAPWVFTSSISIPSFTQVSLSTAHPGVPFCLPSRSTSPLTLSTTPIASSPTFCTLRGKNS